MSSRLGSVRGLVIAVLAVTTVIAVMQLRSPDDNEVDATVDVAVHTTGVSRTTLRRHITAYGTVEPAPALDGMPPAGALITPFVGGVISEVLAIEGRRVDSGTVLFRLDSRMADVTVQGARAQVEFSERAVQRQEELLSSDGTSQRSFEEAQARLAAARADLASAMTDLAYLNITTPLTGIVTRLRAVVGQAVDPSAVLARVVDTDRLVVTAQVPRREIDGVAPGTVALLGPDADGPEGRVAVLDRSVDPSTGAYRVQVSIPKGAGLTPGEFTQVRLVAEERANVLTVPLESIVTASDGSTWIMVVDGDQAMRQDVTVGLREGGLAEVAAEGLSVGTKVVTMEAYSLPERTRVRVVGG
jgi:membrane fusion protein, multidrug efflux system